MPTQYLDHGGSVSSVTVEGDVPFPDVPEGCKVITAEEYAATLAEIKTVVRKSREASDVVERQEAQDAYDALRKAGIPDPVAQRLVGYIPVDPSQTRTL